MVRVVEMGKVNALDYADDILIISPTLQTPGIRSLPVGWCCVLLRGIHYTPSPCAAASKVCPGIQVRYWTTV